MKKVILLVLWNLALASPVFYTLSCGPSKEEIEQMELQKLGQTTKQVGSYQIVVIDGCEYIRYASNSHSLTHKGNCKNRAQH